MLHARVWSPARAPDFTHNMQGASKSMIVIEKEEPSLLSGRAYFGQHAGPQRGCSSRSKILVRTLTSTRFWTPCGTPWRQVVSKWLQQQPCSSTPCCCC